MCNILYIIAALVVILLALVVRATWMVILGLIIITVISVASFLKYIGQ